MERGEVMHMKKKEPTVKIIFQGRINKQVPKKKEISIEEILKKHKDGK